MHSEHWIADFASGIDNTSENILKLGDTIDVTLSIHSLADNVDLVCDIDATNEYFCGERDLEILNVLDGDAIIDYSTHTLYSYT